MILRPLLVLLLMFSVQLSAAPSRRADEQALPLPVTELGEPSLYGLARDRRAEAYRFIWQARDGGGVILSVTRLPDGRARLSVREFVGELNAGAAQTQGQMRVGVMSVQQFARFKAYLRVCDFWRLPIMAARQGNQWTIEGVQSGNYRWLTQGAPRDRYFMEAAMYLARLASLPLNRFLVADPSSGWWRG